MKGFLLDLNRCTGCHACRLACSIENRLGEEESWRAIYTFNPQRHPGIARFHLSLGCQHCAEAACMEACPAAAYRRDAATGAVLVDGNLCIGCRYCLWACPFDAPRYDPAAGTVAKCTLCHNRLLAGNDPACVALCPTGALQYAEMEPGPSLRTTPGFPQTDLDPAMRFVPLRSGDTGPEMAAGVNPELPASAGGDSGLIPEPKVTLDADWPLAFFTMAAAVLVAIACAAFAGMVRIDPADFLTASLVTLATSAIHLGQWRRAPRALLNLRRSWLSREVYCYAAFTAITVAALSLPAFKATLAWPAAIFGYASLYCIDRVYGMVSRGGWSRLHSARSLPTGLFLLGVLTGHSLLAGATGLLKLVLYAYRQSWTRSPARLLTAALRLGIGFVVPLAAWGRHPGWVLSSVLIGEVIDRCEFYLDLQIMTPERQIASALKEKLDLLHRHPVRPA